MNKNQIEVKILDLSDKIGSLYNQYHSNKKDTAGIKVELQKICTELNNFIHQI